MAIDGEWRVHRAVQEPRWSDSEWCRADGEVGRGNHNIGDNRARAPKLEGRADNLAFDLIFFEGIKYIFILCDSSTICGIVSYLKVFVFKGILLLLTWDY